MPVKFSWRSYSQPTPQNYLRLAKLVKRILYGLTTGSILAADSKLMSVILVLCIPAVEELVQFFSDASIEANTINVEGEIDKQPIVVIDKVEPKPTP